MNPEKIIQTVQDYLEPMCYGSHQNTLAHGPDVSYIVGILWNSKTERMEPEIMDLVTHDPRVIAEHLCEHLPPELTLVGLVVETMTIVNTNDFKGPALITYGELVNGYKVGFISVKDGELFDKPYRISDAGKGDGELLDKIFMEYVKLKAKQL